jgi:hypothetical protein
METPDVSGERQGTPDVPDDVGDRMKARLEAHFRLLTDPANCMELGDITPQSAQMIYAALLESEAFWRDRMGSEDYDKLLEHWRALADDG